jgi:hypothetical protein
MVVAGSSNSVANHGSAAAGVAAKQLEVLKAIPYGDARLAPGGGVPPATPFPGSGPVSVCGLPVPGSYNCDQVVPGIGTIHVQWAITGAAGAPLFIEVTAESTAPAVRQRSRAHFTTMRTP